MWTSTLAAPLACAVLIALALLPATAKGGSVSVRSDAREGHEFSSKSDLRIYENVVAFRDSHPDRFDYNHVFYFHLLTEAPMMDRMVSDWEAHPRRFDYWNPFLCRVLDGYTIFMDDYYAFRTDPPPATRVTSQGGQNPVTSQARQDPPGPGDGGGTGGISAQSVPEPSPAILLLIGATALLAIAVIRKLKPRLSHSCPHTETTTA
jgi:hypothetical protein